jgi:LmbE family N-acetylglucosaminyl deacetylase
LSVTDQLVARLRSELVEWRPEVVYVTHPREMHRDHRAAAQLVRRAVSELPAEMARPEVWMYEVWTPLQHFDRIVDVSDYVDCKLKAVRAHASQCSVMRFDEACRGLARYRGEMHLWPGGDYAEVFREWRPTGGTCRPRFQGPVSRGTS